MLDCEVSKQKSAPPVPVAAQAPGVVDWAAHCTETVRPSSRGLKC